MLRGSFRSKSLDAILSSSASPGRSLKRTLGAWQLTMLGIGAIIGAGIFSTVGTAAAGGAEHAGAGPAIVLSFALTAVACTFAALCYAEWGSIVPISGSAYTYAYATLGEFLAWIIGWDLIIEYAIGNTAIAISWSGYFQQLCAGFGWDIPAWLGVDYRTAAQAVASVAEARAAGADVSALGASVLHNAQALELAPRVAGIPLVLNLPAFAVVMAITWVLYRGVRESAWLNSAMVVLKLLIVLFFIALGAFYVKPEHWTPFAPNGFKGIGEAAAILFFAYIGFDAISTASEEAKNPQRDMPIAILGSLVVCTVIYIAVGFVLTGLLPWRELGTAEPLASAFSGLGMDWAAGIISLGAVFATTSVLVVFQLGQPRIFFSMARDGLLPSFASRIHPRFGTPHVTTLLTGVFVAVLSSVANLDEIVQLTNIGTLFAFMLVCVGVTVLRLRDPAGRRGFRVPFGPFVVPGLGTAGCIFLMVYLPPASWWRFVGWLVLGIAVYLSYSYGHSVLGRAQGRPQRMGAAQAAAALGAFVLALALFVLPHDAVPSELLRAARDAAAADHARAAWGLWAGLAGLVVLLGGWLLAAHGQSKRDQ
jgi:APA family basic amino acid/polyamine antiporter